MGRDSDSEWALGEVGRAGVAVDTLADMEDLFADIDLSKVSTSMTINGPAPIVMAMYIAVAEKTRSEEHTSELQSLMRISYAVFCLKKKKIQNIYKQSHTNYQL